MGNFFQLGVGGLTEVLTRLICSNQCRISQTQANPELCLAKYQSLIKPHVNGGQSLIRKYVYPIEANYQPQ